MSESTAKQARHAAHVHCYACGRVIWVEDGQEVPATVALVPVPGPDGRIAFTQVPRPICGSCADEAAKARSRLVVARGPGRGL